MCVAQVINTVFSFAIIKKENDLKFMIMIGKLEMQVHVILKNEYFI